MKIKNIKIKLHYSLLLGILALILITRLHASILTNIICGIIISIIIYGSVLMHEIAHVLIANRLGYEHENIIIRAYDAWAEIYLDNTPSRHQILIFVAGPIMNLILAIIAIAISYMLDIDLFKIITLRTAYLPLIISNLFWINFLLAISNMLPAYPLDGGRILENILSYFTPAPGATYIAIYISLATGGFIMAIGYYISLYMIALFGAYIIFSAHQSLKAIND